MNKTKDMIELKIACGEDLVNVYEPLISERRYEEACNLLEDNSNLLGVLGWFYDVDSSRSDDVIEKAVGVNVYEEMKSMRRGARSMVWGLLESVDASTVFKK